MLNLKAETLHSGIYLNKKAHVCVALVILNLDFNYLEEHLILKWAYLCLQCLGSWG